MSITHTILVPVAATTTPSVGDGQVTDIAVVAHFEVDADSPVDTSAWAVYVEVGDAAFDDLCEDFARSLIDGYTHLGFMTRIEVLSDDWRKLVGRDFVECIPLLLVGV